MSAVSVSEIKQEFLRSKIGLAGIGILVILILVSIFAAIVIPVETFQEWNNPSSWISFPKTAIPVWVNLVLLEKIPEHKIIDEPQKKIMKLNDVSFMSFLQNIPDPHYYKCL
jgi:peptide/nickel transport system permease protein